jgi:hypothetical protein
MLLLVIYTVGFCTNALEISSKSIYYYLFISPNGRNMYQLILQHFKTARVPQSHISIGTCYPVWRNCKSVQYMWCNMSFHSFFRLWDSWRCCTSWNVAPDEHGGCFRRRIYAKVCRKYGFVIIYVINLSCWWYNNTLSTICLFSLLVQERYPFIGTIHVTFLESFCTSY